MTFNNSEQLDFNQLLAIALSELAGSQSRELSVSAKLALLQATQLLLSAKQIQADGNLLLQILWKIAAINPYDDFIHTCLTCGGINNFQELRELRNRIAIAYNSQGNTLYHQGQVESAALQYQKALTIGEQLPPLELMGIYLNAGMACFRQENFQKAALYFQKALEIQPHLIDAKQMLVRVNYLLETQQAGYQFSQDWFSRNLGIWQENLSKFKNLPNLNVLEIGSWEGRSTCWLLNNILTHPSSRITCIDTFEGGGGTHLSATDTKNSIEAKFDFNIALTGGAEKVIKIIEESRVALRKLPLSAFALIYIDGSHLACDVLEDTLLSWGLLKQGGFIIFDDYDQVFPNLLNQNTKIGIDAFLMSFCNKIQLIHQSHQIIIQKLAI